MSMKPSSLTGVVSHSPNFGTATLDSLSGLDLPGLDGAVARLPSDEPMCSHERDENSASTSLPLGLFARLSFLDFCTT